jgi:hypothetical protein
MGYDSDIYYTPEKFGLTVVREFDEPGLSYEFNLFVIWKDGNGQYCWAEDSGCSCPTPFEGITSKDDLATGSYDDALRHMAEWERGWRD